MSTTKKQCEKTAYTTAAGELTGFISLSKPSTILDKEGIWQANLLVSEIEGKKLLEQITALRTARFKQYGKGTTVREITQCVPYTTVDEETGEAIPDKEGRYIIKAKLKAYIKDNIPQQSPIVIDSKLHPISSNVIIAAGSIAKLGLILEGYTSAGKTGVSVRLNVAQILKLVEYKTNGNIDQFDFQEEADGYRFVEPEPQEVNNTTADDEEEELDF